MGHFRPIRGSLTVADDRPRMDRAASRSFAVAFEFAAGFYSISVRILKECRFKYSLVPVILKRFLPQVVVLLIQVHSVLLIHSHHLLVLGHHFACPRPAKQMLLMFLS
jgi:hypothetical protein